MLVSSAVSHSTTAVTETIATSAGNGGFKPLKNSRDQKVVKGLSIVCTETSSWGEQQQGDCTGAVAEVLPSLL